MDYLSAFEISASGMRVAKLQLETVAMNLANANSTSTSPDGHYKAQRVVSVARSFDSYVEGIGFRTLPGGAEIADVQSVHSEPRIAYEPGHPHADEKGFVRYPAINPVTEMMSLIEAVRSYEANVRAMNAAKTMALRALEIGG